MSKKIFTKFMKVMPLFGLCFLLMGLQEANAQTVISGKVTDMDNNPMPGVNVVIKNTTLGTITDVEGNYNLTLEEGAENLLFSFVGFLTEEITIGNQSIIDVQLVPDIQSLSEVVVVGYGTQRKQDLTGSVSTVKGEVLSTAPAPALSNSLAGKVTGVLAVQNSGQPGEDGADFFIRGKSSLGNNNPLVVIDGIPRDDWQRMDPNTIESLTVLKDAASAAVYGARASNGVILITTKRGETGKPQFSYTATFGSQSPTILPELMDAGQYAEYYTQASINSNTTIPYTEEQIQQYKDGTLPGTDWWGEVMEDNAPIQQHNLSVTGGTKDTKYFISMGALDQRGLHPIFDFKRYNLRSNLDTKIGENFSIGLDIAGRIQQKTEPTSDDVYLHLVQSKPTFPAYVMIDGKRELGYNGINVSPIGTALHSGNSSSDDIILQSTLKLKYDMPFVEGLSAGMNYSYDRTHSFWRRFREQYTFYVHDNINESYSAATSPPINLQQNTYYEIQKTFQASLNYARNFGDHSISGLLLTEAIEYNRQETQAYRDGFISPEFDQLFAGINGVRDNAGWASETARLGYVGRLTYSFKDKYLFQANGRYDGSYNFAADKRWGFFPAVSAGWRISEEPFMQGIDFITNLKIRASWGQFGNDRIDPYQFISGYNISSAGYVLGTNPTFFGSIDDDRLANPDITWETATNTDIGLDLGLLNNRISLEVVYFKKRTEDILSYRTGSVPETFGGALPRENFGIVDNEGIEAALNLRQDFGELNVSVGGNLTFAKNKLIFVDEPEDVLPGIRRTGRALDQEYGYVAAGLFQTEEEIENWADQGANITPGDIKYVDINGDDVINADDRQPIGRSRIPELVYGFNLSAEYKGFQLTAYFQGATRYSYYRFMDAFGLGATTFSVLTDSWSETNTDAAYPKLYTGQTPNNSRHSSFWINDGNYLKLRNVELAYNLPKLNILEKAGIGAIRLAVSGNNFIVSSSDENFDPEGFVGGRPLYYPLMKSVNFSVNVQF